MRSGLIAMAERVVSLSDANHPADMMLREVLKAQRGLSRADSREVSRAVFSYYRWRDWLHEEDPMLLRFMHALELADRFASEPESFRDEELKKAVPPWVGAKLVVQPEWLRSIQAEPVLWLRARKGLGVELSAKLPAVPHPRIADALRYEGMEDLFRHKSFQDGDFELQDISSQAVGHLCNPKPGETWWDACAGEGGKTLHLSSLMENRGLIWASDRAEWRLKKLKQRAARAKCFNYRTAVWDGGAKPPTKTKFDGILVDAPCSGLGTWGRNPHARWTAQARDCDELAKIQGSILANVAGSLKPGGRLIYSVCTVTKQETTDIVEAFNRQFPDFAPVPLQDAQPPDAAPHLSNCLLLQDEGGNGMFVATWQRKA